MRKVLIFCLALLCFVQCEYATTDVGGYYEGVGDANGRTGDNYNEIIENPFIKVADEPTSTFSIDADGASYGNTRRFLFDDKMIPPTGAVRTEELINYFPLNYEDDGSGRPISLNGEVSQCPWATDHKLIRIGIKGKTIPDNALPPSNLVLLVDVSGSMAGSDRLGLLKKGFVKLVDELSSEDRLAIVTYAGSAGVALQSTSGNHKSKIKDVIKDLSSGGGTAGAQGIITAYEIAQQNFIEGGNNRVIIGTDGDFNVGISNQEELVNLIEEKRGLGIFLTVLGVGRGNLNDGMMEALSNHGNGTYEYIDSFDQAKKVFVHEFSKFYTVAKDVKVQVNFNPSLVESYRLIGYENRLLQNDDFEDDEEDAGEIGAGQNITALYEIVPKSSLAVRTVPTFTIQFRYKEPDSDISQPLSLEVLDQERAFLDSSEDMIFASSVAGFGLLLIDSQYKSDLTYEQVLTWLGHASSYDPHGYRGELKGLVKQAKSLAQ